ncbi:HD-GYP domain-containing protein [Geotoga petraea]|uniref:HD-GYP domain-containing protein n=1 Tax=Geotoga petraea TaxID=28234 RepID=UPI00197A8B18|nr:HD-GYP domain-containing protein [Geotoga petraea]
MKFKQIFKRTVRNISLQNYFLVATIIIFWGLVLAIFSTTLSTVSSNNLENFEKTVEDYRQKLSSAKKYSEYKSLESFFSEVYFYDLNMNIIKTIPNNLEEKKIDPFTFNGNDYYLYSNKDEIYLASRFSDGYSLSKIKMESLKLNNESVLFSSFDKNGRILTNGIFKKNMKYNDINHLTFSDFNFYLNDKNSYGGIKVVTSLNITLQVYFLFIASIITLAMIIWNLNSKKKTVKLLQNFEDEYEDMIESIEILLNELRLLDDQSMKIIPEVQFDSILEKIKNKNYEFQELKELREVEELAVREFIELIENLSASYEEISSSNDELENLYKELELTYNKLEGSYIAFSKKLSKIAEKYDDITGKHIERVADYSKLIAEKLGKDSFFTNNIFYYSPLHDLGKLMIDKKILNKEGRLTIDEYEEMKKHTLYAAEILDEDDEFSFAKNIALYHHEKFDGSGYPYGLSGENIPLEARIVALADVYDSLRSKRTYKPALSHEEAYKIIVEGDIKTQPTHFDPKILKIFKENHLEFKSIYEIYEKN